MRNSILKRDAFIEFLHLYSELKEKFIVDSIIIEVDENAELPSATIYPLKRLPKEE